MKHDYRCHFSFPGIDHLDRLSKNLENVIIQPSESINKCLVSDTSSISITSNSKSSGFSQSPPVEETPSIVAIESEQLGASKKKGPAPPRPVPPKREIRKVPRKVFEQDFKDSFLSVGGVSCGAIGTTAMVEARTRAPRRCEINAARF